MIDTTGIKKKILDMAVCGQLSKHCENDTPVSELLEEYLPALDINLPEIPYTWRYCKFDHVLINRDSERVPVSVADRKKLDKKYDYYGASGVIDKVDRYLFNEKLLLIGEDGANLLSRSTPIAFIAEGKYWVNNHAHVLQASEHVILEYVEMVINSISLVPFVTGSAQPKLSQKMMNKIAIPVPPIEEQQRVVETVNALFEILDKIDRMQIEYSANLCVLKNKIIDAGIRGELTEQLPEDGTGEDAFQCIQSEKEVQIERGRIKKQSPSPEIIEDEIPFEIPENWKWVRLGDIFQHNTGKALNSSNSAGQRFEYITTSNVYWDRFELDDLKTMSFKENELEKCTVKKGDLLICEGGDVGRSAVWPYEKEVKIQNHIHRLRGYLNQISARYYYFIMRSYKSNGLIEGRGIGLQGFSSKRVHTLVVPLPPFSEQKRIAGRIDELLAAIPGYQSY